MRCLSRHLSSEYVLVFDQFRRKPFCYPRFSSLTSTQQPLNFLATLLLHHFLLVLIGKGSLSLFLHNVVRCCDIYFSSGLATSPQESTQLVMRILRNTLAKQGTGVILPQLSRMQLLVPEDHSCFLEAQHRLDVGDALVQVVHVKFQACIICGVNNDELLVPCS